MATKKITLPETWEAFCKQTGRDPKALPDTSLYDDKHKKNAIANFKLPLIIAYCNGSVILDYTNSDQNKYEPWWKVIANKDNPSGSGLSYSGYGYWRTGSCCGPRFAFVSVPILKHVVKHFIKDYEDLYL